MRAETGSGEVEGGGVVGEKDGEEIWVCVPTAELHPATWYWWDCSNLRLSLLTNVPFISNSQFSAREPLRWCCSYLLFQATRGGCLGLPSRGGSLEESHSIPIYRGSLSGSFYALGTSVRGMGWAVNMGRLSYRPHEIKKSVVTYFMCMSVTLCVCLVPREVRSEHRSPATGV